MTCKECKQKKHTLSNSQVPEEFATYFCTKIKKIRSATNEACENFIGKEPDNEPEKDN